MQKIRNLRVYYIGTLALTLTAAVLRTLLFFLSTETGSDYFKPDTGLPPVFAAVLIVAVAAILLFPLLLRDRVPTATVTGSLPQHLISTFCALCFLLAFVSTCTAKRSIALPTLLWLVGMLALLAATVYFLAKTPLCPLGTTEQAIFGSLALIAIGCLIAVTYFDITTPMNASTKVHLHLALLSVMLCLLYELRDTVGAPLPRVRTAFTALTFFLTTTVGISDLIANHAKGFIYLSHDLLLVSISLYTAAHAIAELKALSYAERKTL